MKLFGQRSQYIVVRAILELFKIFRVQTWKYLKRQMTALIFLSITNDCPLIFFPNKNYWVSGIAESVKSWNLHQIGKILWSIKEVTKKAAHGKTNCKKGKKKKISNCRVQLKICSVNQFFFLQNVRHWDENISKKLEFPIF